ncbi:MAG: hypothetical protein JW973_03995 [Bacteroidales bacterium]|nr:hypothetical protein [Bacteroidales bacterium]
MKITPVIKEKNKFWIKVVILLFPLIIYSNTLRHDYALDDAMVITHNQYTLKGFSGLKDIFTKDSFAGFYLEKKVHLPGGRYRPLSIATYAIEYAFFGLNPHISHLVNILLYAFTGLSLYYMLLLFFGNKDGTTALISVPTMATLIFMAHPIHTEVVANIKGRDEILSLLFALIALISVILYIDKKRFYWLIIGFVSFFLALLSKENAITFVLIIPLSIWFFREVPFRRQIAAFFPVLSAAVVFLLIRNSITGGFQVSAAGELMNNPFLYATVNQKYPTILLTLGLYLKLLFWPHPLTFDYYPYHIELTDWSNKWVIIILILYIFMFLYAIIKLSRRNPAVYSILFFIISVIPVSNLLINMGTFMNERFVYQASVAFATGIAWIIFKLFDWPGIQRIISGQSIKIAFFAAVILALSIRTFARNYAWKNDYTLFLTDVKTSANSAKSNCAAGGILLDRALACTDVQKKKEDLIRAVQYLTRATVIDPTYSDVWRKLGTAQYELTHDVPEAFWYYCSAIRNNPGDETSYNNIHFILLKYNNKEHKIELYKELLKINPKRPDINTKLGVLYGKEKKDYSLSIAYFKEAVRLEPTYKQAYKGLGVAYQMTGDYKQSMYWLEYALKLDTLDASIYQLMGKTALQMGDKEKASFLFIKADQLKSKITPAK